MVPSLNEHRLRRQGPKLHQIIHLLSPNFTISIKSLQIEELEWTYEKKNDFLS